MVRNVLAAVCLAMLVVAPGSAAGPAGVHASGGHGVHPSRQDGAVASWPSFRGPRASGIADGTGPPVRWDAGTGEGLLWKATIPGVGHSSPVAWGERVFVTTAVSSDPDPEFVHGDTGTTESAADRTTQSWRLLCLDRATGEILWERIARAGVPRTARHLKASYANPTPATDGEVVVASFGSEGLYAWNLNGEPLWQRDLGVLDGGWTPAPGTHWGYGSSPLLWRDLVIVQADVQNLSWLGAFQRRTGEAVWRVDRQEDTSWSTPTVWEGEGGAAELLVSGTGHYRGYDPRTGEELWRLPDGTDVKIPTPVVARDVTVGGEVTDLLLFGGGSTHQRPPFWAVRPGARGEISVEEAGVPGDAGSGAPGRRGAGESRPAARDGRVTGGAGPVVWRADARPHVTTPLAYRGTLWVLADNGILTAYDLATGERLNRLRVGGRGGAFAASPVAADGRIYLMSEEGDAFVLGVGPDAELLSTNPVGEPVLATPALLPGMVLVRGREHLFAFGHVRPGGATAQAVPWRP